VRNPYLATNAWGWATDPQCLRITLNTLYDRYHCDLFCVENGIGWNDVFEDGTVHDDYRTHYTRQRNKPVMLIDSPFFTVKLLETDRPFHRKLFKYDSFVIYTCIAGDCNISVRSTHGFGKDVMPDFLNSTIHLSEGNSCLIPASVADFDVTPNNENGITKLLESYIDNKNY
jgi:hypothetical protein